VAWAAAPHGEPARQTSIVGAVAVAGGDESAVAWLELKHGAADGTLHLVMVDGEGRMRSHRQLTAGADATAFRLADAGQRVFVLATEHRTPAQRTITVHRFVGDGDELLQPLTDAYQPRWQETEPGDFQVAAGGDEVAVAMFAARTDAAPAVHLLGRDGAWVVPTRLAERTLIGAGAGHVVTYAEQSDHTAEVVLAPGRAAEQRMLVARPSCFGDGRPPTVTSVVALRGGYARLSRRGNEGCIDGIRDGRPFAYRDVPLAGIAAARLQLDDGGGISVREEQDAQVEQRRVILPEQPGGAYRVQIVGGQSGPEVRYRLFGGVGRQGVTALATRATAEETQVVLERMREGEALPALRGAPSARWASDDHPQVLAPQRHFQPDHRPILRALGALPLALLALSLLGAARLRRRVRRMRPGTTLGASFAPGRAVVEGELESGAETPSGGLRIVCRGGQRMSVFVEGAEVLRASEVRPRSQPRGDAVDVASGATVVATGIVESGGVYRADATLRARHGDLVLVGCSLAEARHRLGRRFFGTLVLFGGAASLVLALALAGR
jgi:hypothetical protein